MAEQQNTLNQGSVPAGQQSPDATTTTDAGTTTTGTGTEATTTTTDTGTEATTTTADTGTTATDTGTTTIVQLTDQQYNDLIAAAKDSNMLESTLLTVLIGLLIGYVGVRGLFDAWRS